MRATSAGERPGPDGPDPWATNVSGGGPPLKLPVSGVVGQFDCNGVRKP
jgi:hypothetical protein